MKIGLVGWGVETQSAYRHFGSDHTYLICNEEPLNNPPTDSEVEVQTLSGERPPGLTGNASDLSYLEGLDTCDTVVSSPAAKKNLETYFPPDSTIWDTITSTLQIFFEQSPNKNIIGVTGTKGKGTTSSLISVMLEQAGKSVHLAGNIGQPVLDLLPIIQPDDWIVLELSNFQLYKFPYSPHIAIHLMMMPEHIAEWHKSMDDYVEAKRNIFAHQNEQDIAIYYPENQYSSQNVAASPGKHIPYMQDPGASVIDGQIVIDSQHIADINDVALRGTHNLQNVCAAVTAAWQVTQDTVAIGTAIKLFIGLEHRLQTVRTIHDVEYVDDSFGTTPDTTLVAMDAFINPKIMIIGGHDKGSDYTPIADRLKQDDVRHAICIGPVGNLIATQLESSGLHDKVTYKTNANEWTMQEIVELAQAHTQPKDIVLLSCGSSSFGIFADYKDRGNQFIQAVENL